MRKSFLLVALCALALPLAAQNTDIEALSGLQFNFGNPGARALGMGGAFIGLADDASAAEANPAGLTILRKAEVSLEARNYQETQLFTTSGTFPDVVRTPFTHYSDRVVATFASAVYPIKNKFTVGIYYHEPLKNQGGGVVFPVFNQQTGQLQTKTPNFYLPAGGGTPISLADCTALRNSTHNPAACLEFRVDPFISALDVRQRTFGFAGGWQVTPKFSVGLNVRYQMFKEGAFTFRFDPNTFDTKNVTVQATAHTDGTSVNLTQEHDVTFGVGFKWAPYEKLSCRRRSTRRGRSSTRPTFFSGAQTNGESCRLPRRHFTIRIWPDRRLRSSDLRR